MKPLIQLQLKMLSKISLAAALTASLTLFALVYILTYGKPETYLQFVTATVLTEQELLPATLVAGLGIIIVTAVVTGLIAVYSTFRVAGPLYRFARNVEHAKQHGPDRPIPIRHDDALQEEWLALKQSMEMLDQHYSALRTALGEALKAETEESLAEHLKEVTTLVERVHA